MTSGGSWRLIDVQVALDDWTRNESPHPALRRIVIEWLLTRQDDPYLDVRREPAFDNVTERRAPTRWECLIDHSGQPANARSGALATTASCSRVPARR